MSQLRVLLIALLCLTAGCAAEESRESTHRAERDAVTSAEVLRPYLGRWRPTSFAEQQNIVSLTISATELSLQIGGVLTLSNVTQQNGAVVMQWVSREPPMESGALGLVLEQERQTNSAAQEPTREFLRIYWCDDIGQLSGGRETWRCSENLYMRWSIGRHVGRHSCKVPSA